MKDSFASTTLTSIVHGACGPVQVGTRRTKVRKEFFDPTSEWSHLSTFAKQNIFRGVWMDHSCLDRVAFVGKLGQRRWRFRFWFLFHWSQRLIILCSLC